MADPIVTPADGISEKVLRWYLQNGEYKTFAAGSGTQFGYHMARDDMRKLDELCTVDGNTSDGYHTFEELYHYRMLYNAALFSEWTNRYDEKNETRLHNVHKSWKHSDGEPCFGGGWFVVVAQLPTGQITNHYKAEHWDLFKVPAQDMVAPYDGHTPQQVAERLEAYLKAETKA